jgi:hypothetical protein
LRNILAVIFGFVIIFASIIMVANSIRSLQDFAANSPFPFQTDVQGEIQSMELAVLIPIAFGAVIIFYGAWPEKEVEIPTEPTPQPEVREVIQKEVIAKIRCSYCNTLYDATLDRCPYCGAAH